MATNVKQLTKNTKALINNSKALIKDNDKTSGKDVLDDLKSYGNYLREQWVDADKKDQSNLLKLRDDLTTAIKKFDKFLKKK